MELKPKEDQQAIENHKKKLENLASEVELNLSNPSRKIEFSAQSIEQNSYKELIKIITELPIGGVIVYVQDQIELTKVLGNLHRSRIDFTFLSSTDKEGSKKSLNNFNEKRTRRILSEKSVKTDRDDIRAVIFYGMPKSIEKLYTESMKLGLDGKPSKCIVLHRNQDTVRIQKNKLNCNDWDSLDNYMKYNQYCISMINKMSDYCISNRCRRSVIRDYFNVVSTSQIYRDICCDNCQKIIVDQVPPSILFEGVNSRNIIDITSDARLLLNCFKKCDCNINDCNAILVGRMIRFQKSHSLEFFGVGRLKPEGYWTAIYHRLITRYYINESVNKITRNGNRFLRCKNQTLEMHVTFDLKKYLKRKNIQVTLENGKVTTSPKEEFIYEDSNPETTKSKMFQFNSLQSNSDKLFEFETLKKPKLKVEVKEKTPPPEPPKTDWRNAFAALFARKDNEDIFKPPEARKEKKQEVPSIIEDVPQPGSSHSDKNASNDSSNLPRNDQDEEVDDEYIENMRKIRELMHKPFTIPLDDLLDYIEKNAGQAAIKRTLSCDDLEECQTAKVKRTSDE